MSAERITFEQGYEELKRIVARLDDPELPIHEMFEGFRRGKGLEKTLRAYLQEREGELADLEQGNNLAEFEIVAASGAPQSVGASAGSLSGVASSGQPRVVAQSG